jgi:predicted transposase YbfD/YdcC
VPAVASSSPLSVLSAAADLPDRPDGLSEVETITLIAALKSVPDPRKARGLRHSLQALLMLALTGVMAGARSWTALAQWARDGQHKVRLCGPPPSLWTFRRVLCAVDVAAVETALSAWVLGRRAAAARAETGTDAGAGPGAGERVVVACDGKTVRGSRAQNGMATALFGVFEHRHRLVLTQKAIEEGNEIAAFAATLDTLPDLRDVLVTADALHTQREHVDYLHRRGAHYLFTVKGNQPTLHAALAALPWAAVDRQARRQRGHGRTECRSIAVLAADGAAGIDTLFPHAAQVMRVIRSRTDRKTGKRSREVVYAITCLGHRCAEPGLLAGWLQGHWGIENRVHHVRDITHGEDDSRIRTGTGPQLMAALRNTDLNLARLRGETNIAASQRRNAWAGSTAVDTVIAA